MNDNGAITGMDAREDGVYITYVPADGADPVTKKLGEPTITAVERTGTVTNGIYFDISNIDGFEDFILYRNLFPIGKTIYSSHNGASVGISISYNSDTGRLTMKGSTNGTISNGTLYIVQS